LLSRQPPQGEKRSREKTYGEGSDTNVKKKAKGKKPIGRGGGVTKFMGGEGGGGGSQAM